MDTFDLPIYEGRTLKMLTMICEGTGLQISVPLWKGAQTKHVRSAYRKGWKRWAGVPVRVVTDGGGVNLTMLFSRGLMMMVLLLIKLLRIVLIKMV